MKLLRQGREGSICLVGGDPDDDCLKWKITNRDCKLYNSGKHEGKHEGKHVGKDEGKHAGKHEGKHDGKRN